VGISEKVDFVFWSLMTYLTMNACTKLARYRVIPHFIPISLCLAGDFIGSFLYWTLGVILTGPGSVWFGTVVILTRPVQWTANAFTTKVNRAHDQVQFGSIWRTCTGWPKKSKPLSRIIIKSY